MGLECKTNGAMKKQRNGELDDVASDPPMDNRKEFDDCCSVRSRDRNHRSQALDTLAPDD